MNREELKLKLKELELGCFDFPLDVITDKNVMKIIEEIVCQKGFVDLEYADVFCILSGSKSHIIASGCAKGEKRVSKAIKNALNSPLYCDFDIKNANKMLFALYTSKKYECAGHEVSEISKFLENFKNDLDFVWGAYYDDTLGKKVKVTIIATSNEKEINKNTANIEKLELQHKRFNFFKNLYKKIKDYFVTLCDSMFSEMPV